MSVITYSYIKDAETLLSPNFKVGEFRCKDKNDRILIDTDLITLLEQIRAKFGKPVAITSGYRTASYNKGASKSQHVAGTAVDIVISGIKPRVIAQFAMTLPLAVGVGLYEYGPNTEGFVHVDTGAGNLKENIPARTKPTRWYQDNPDGPEKAMPYIGVNDVAPYRVKVTASSLNVRTGPGTDYPRVTTLAKGSFIYISTKTEVPGEDGSKPTTWGYCDSAGGWLSLEYTAKA